MGRNVMKVVWSKIPSSPKPLEGDVETPLLEVSAGEIPELEARVHRSEATLSYWNQRLQIHSSIHTIIRSPESSSHR